jgi:hypothetical protein
MEKNNDPPDLQNEFGNEFENLKSVNKKLEK